MTLGMLDPEKESSKGDLVILRQTLDTHLKKLGIQGRLRSAVVALAGRNTAYHITTLLEGGAINPNQEVDYQKFKEQGLDTVLEVSVQSLGLEGTSLFDPDCLVFMVGKADLWRLSDGALLYRARFLYQTQSLPYKEWAAQNSHEFEQALNEGYRQLAKQIVSKLF